MGWTSYVRALETNTPACDLREGDEAWPGEFSIPLNLQQQVATVKGVLHMDYAEPRVSRVPDAEDESTVIAAAVTMLQALLRLTPSPLEWVFNRVCFRAKFTQGTYKASTDGALRSRERPSEVFAILEVKKRTRGTDRKAVIIQETCQLLGWILECSNTPARFNHHFLSLSQGRDGVFLTFTPYDADHETYLRGKGAPRGFLKMQTIGPFTTSNPEHMTHFGKVMLSVMEILNESIQSDSSSNRTLVQSLHACDSGRRLAIPATGKV
ncbi:hypothetical protein N7535_005847 [Penicillium sp. DV-2018c]|nr:hypothetical protein N7461_009423 [Penicillium sp. DV-2018c]KAJ5572187.1 hypothetical protein N7535_005847 [Penicillium sp. DV-2018c]